VYPWLARQLLGDTSAARYREQPIRTEPDSAVLVFLKTMVVDRKLTFADLPAGSYTPPPAALDEAGLKSYLRGLASQQLRDAWPKDAASLESFRKLYGTGFRALLKTRLPETAVGLARGSFAGAGYTGGRWLLSRPGEGDWTPAVWLRPATDRRAATILLSPRGKAALADPENAALVSSLLAAGQSVLAPDLFLTGEHLLPEGAKTERDESSNQFATYNRTDTQERVHDVLTAIAFLRGQGVERINLVGAGDAGVWALLAASAAERSLDHVVAYDMESSSDETASGLRNLVPGLFKLGGLATAAALAAPTPVLVLGADPALAGPRIPAAYAAAGAPDGFRRAARGSSEEIVRWVTAPGGR
jgi:dienelactone hydrolase